MEKSQTENLKKALTQPFYIARDGYGILGLYGEKPKKTYANGVHFWKGNCFFINSTLFEDVKDDYLYVDVIKTEEPNEKLLVNTFRGYHYIARNKDNSLYIYSDKPIKIRNTWGCVFGLQIKSSMFRNVNNMKCVPLHLLK